jgi:hypothetical protein
MPLYPDLAACGISFMHFAFHLSGGLADVEAFWQKRKMSTSAHRLLFAAYSRQGMPHTVSLQWARSHEKCCDVFIGFDARRPSEVWPRLPRAGHALREKDLREFLETIAKIDGSGRVQARYGFPWNKGLDAIFPFPVQVRPISITLEVFGVSDKPAMTVTYEKVDGSWIAIVAPTGRFAIKDEPVSNTFFKAPYDTACLLAKTFQSAEAV